jgi:hypothetical protein
MTRMMFVLRATVISVVVGLGLLYLGDDLAGRYRMAHRTARSPLDEVSVYTATRLKNGKVEVFYGSPETRTCIRAVFPHFGYSPCWYLARRKIDLIAP